MTVAFKNCIKLRDNAFRSGDFDVYSLAVCEIRLTVLGKVYRNAIVMNEYSN